MHEKWADEVIGVTYESGTGFATWDYIKANGTGLKFTD